MNADKSVSGRLIYAARLLRTARAERLLGEGIYAGQDALLRELSRQDGQTMGALAAALGVRPPTVTKMVARMETQGLVRRAASPSAPAAWQRSVQSIKPKRFWRPRQEPSSP